MIVNTATTLPLRTNADGTLLVGETRVTLDTVVGAFEQGCTPEEISQQYSTLRLADIYNVIAYYLDHQAELQVYLAERQNLSLKVRTENEERNPAEGLRQRLMARGKTAADS